MVVRLQLTDYPAVPSQTTFREYLNDVVYPSPTQVWRHEDQAMMMMIDRSIDRSNERDHVLQSVCHFRCLPISTQLSRARDFDFKMRSWQSVYSVDSNRHTGTATVFARFAGRNVQRDCVCTYVHEVGVRQWGGGGWSSWRYWLDNILHMYVIFQARLYELWIVTKCWPFI